MYVHGASMGMPIDKYTLYLYILIFYRRSFTAERMEYNYDKSIKLLLHDFITIVKTAH